MDYSRFTLLNLHMSTDIVAGNTSAILSSQSSQSSLSLIRKAINILGSISDKWILRRRRVCNESISAGVYASSSSWSGRAG